MTFGEKLQALRRERGWSQEDLASEIPISRQAVSKWESSAAVPDTENVLRLSDIFGVSTDYLLREELTGDGDLPAVKRREAELREEKDRTSGLLLAGLRLPGLPEPSDRPAGHDGPYRYHRGV